jgi:hypothetical protein
MKRATTTLRGLVLLAVVAAIAAAVALPRAFATTLNSHTVLLDGGAKIIPWTGLPTPTDGFDRVLRDAWDYVLHQVPDDPSTGWPAYFSQSYLDPDTQQMAGWPSNPAGMNAMFIESALAYYAYSGDTALLTFAQSLADHHLDAGLTPSGWVWPNVPYASGDAGSLTYQGAAYGDTTGVGDGRGVIEPDKIGELGYSLLRLYEVTGLVRYRDAAVVMGEVLAAHVAAGDATHSPWPFRVYAETGVVREEYSAHVISPIELFDELIRLGLGGAAVPAARQIAWTWLMTYPMQNDNWSNYFEDVPIRSSATNITQLNALMTARYLLRHRDTDANWEAHVRGIISWVEANFGVADSGATTIREQAAFPHPMGSHTSRYASVNALLYAATGDAAARDKAYRSFSWATYMDRGDGVIIDGPEVNNQWFTDGYADYIRHFLVGLGAIPEWAPSDANHLTDSTSLVTSIFYDPTAISYVTQVPSSEALRVRFVPQSVTADGKVLPMRPDLAQQGWTYAAATDVLRIRHDDGTNVVVAPEPRAAATALAGLAALLALGTGTPSNPWNPRSKKSRGARAALARSRTLG